MSDYVTIEREASDIRQSLKSAIDTWPVSVLIAVQKFALVENQRLEMEPVDNSRPDMERRNRGYERLKKYFGTIDREINWKQELQEALDEKYNRAY
jgi:hypothetical protein